jgi:D-glycero-alpha-D-manno-heptose-7-phosphate kinase
LRRRIIVKIKTSTARVPFRISFFGGGTDFKEWYQENETSVISTSINLYSYVVVRTLLSLYDHKIRLRYYRREEIKDINNIEHPSARNILKLMQIKKDIEIIHFADLPARSGVGSSSTFSVGLIHALANLEGLEFSKFELAKKATYVEQVLNKEIVGCQDQVAVAYGGFNQISFSSQEIQVKPMPVSRKKIIEFQDNLLMFFCGNLRNSSEILKEQLSKTKQNSSYLKRISEIASEAYSNFKTGDLNSVGNLLNDSWKIKKKLSSKISNSLIDDAYEAAISAGALGGKLLGAGSGGFLLIYANKEHHKNICSKLSKFEKVEFKFEESGSKILSF